MSRIRANTILLHNARAKTYPAYLLGRCIGKCVETGVSFAIFYSYPCCCHHRLQNNDNTIKINELELKQKPSKHVL